MRLKQTKTSHHLSMDFGCEEFSRIESDYYLLYSNEDLDEVRALNSKIPLL